MNKNKILTCLVALLTVFLFSACSMLSDEKIKLRDLEFTILSDEVIPEELKTVLEEKKETPFQITYTDHENLYICAGYGKQRSGGYSIVVEELYLTEDNIYVSTSLLGPDPADHPSQMPTYPKIVIKTELLEQPVIFE